MAVASDAPMCGALFREKSVLDFLFASSTLSEQSVKGLELARAKGRVHAQVFAENKLAFSANHFRPSMCLAENLSACF